MSYTNISTVMYKQTRKRFWVILTFVLWAFYLLYFSPALMHGVLAIGDGVVFYYPYFLNKVSDLWSENIFSGYANVGDLQAQLFYLPRLLIRNFNLFIISAYVVAAVGMFGLALRLTGSRAAALISALVAANGGFMMAHLGHVAIIHAAAWGPLMLWSIASLSRRLDPLWVVVGAISVSLCMLGGHPQPSIYCLLLTATFALHEGLVTWRSSGARQAGRFALYASGVFVLGGLISLIGWLPFLETVSDGVRGSWSVADFNEYSIDWHTILLLFFPTLFGGTGLGGPYFGPPNLTELTIYAGLLPVLLAICGLAGWRVDRRQWFWFGVALVTLALTLGTRTPLGEVVATLPGLGRFRCQARFGLLLLFSVSVLAAYGTAAVLRGQLSRRIIGTVIAVGSLLFAVATCWCVYIYPELIASAHAVGFFLPPFWRNQATTTPIVLFIAAIFAFILFAIRRDFIALGIAVVVVTLDLGSFGWFYEWRYAAVPAEQLTISGEAEAVVARIASQPGRVLPTTNALQMPLSPFVPNFNAAFGVPLAVGYGPLLSARKQKFAGEDTVGGFGTYWPAAPVMDVLGVRWYAVEHQGSSAGLGQCAAAGGQRVIRAVVPAGHERDVLRITSHMGCSAGIVDHAVVMTAQLFDKDMKPLVDAEPVLRAGDDTSEWAYDRLDVKPLMQHRRARVVDSFPVEGYEGHWYEAQGTALLGSARVVELALDPQLSSSVRLKKVEAVAPDGKTISLALLPAGPTIGDPININGLPLIVERKSFKGLVWNLCRARAIDSAQLTGALMGDGREFNAFDEALIETGIEVPRPDCHGPGEVRVLARSPGSWKIETVTDGRSVLAISESYHRGWQATIDGIAQHPLPVDGLILGLDTPPGRHVVELKFMPRSFVVGLAAAIFGLAACAGLIFASFFARRRPHAEVIR